MSDLSPHLPSFLGSWTLGHAASSSPALYSQVCPFLLSPAPRYSCRYLNPAAELIQVFSPVKLLNSHDNQCMQRILEEEEYCPNPRQNSFLPSCAAFFCSLHFLSMLDLVFPKRMYILEGWHSGLILLFCAILILFFGQILIFFLNHHNQLEPVESEKPQSIMILKRVE